VDRLLDQGTLVETLRSRAGAAGGSEGDVVGRLMARLRSLPSLPAAPDETTAPELPAARLSADTPPPPGPAARGVETTQEVYDFLAPPQGPGEIGRLGGYRVLKVLGQGGMGVVFEGEDVRLKRRVALKAMRPSLAARDAACRRFLREAEATAAVRSDHVVTIYQVGEEGGVPFLAMEFLEGLPLDRWLQPGRTPTVAQVLRIGREVALGLAAAHEKGLIHRDIKPANIWLEAAHGGRVKILDFGLARAVGDDVQLTQSGAIMGTPAYMAPEQARGEKVDHRTDLFSLGCVLYRLCAGRPPFRGETTLAVLSALALDDPRPVHEVNPAVPPALSELVMQLLRKDPAGRPASARAVAEALQAIERSRPGRGPAPAAAVPAATAATLTLTPVPAAAPAQPAAAPSRGRRRRLVAVAAGLLGAAAVLAGIVVIIRDKQGNEVGRFNAPEGGKVEIVDDAGKRPAPKEGAGIAPAPLAPLSSGEALSPTALVQHPAKLPGVRTWSIELRNQQSTTAVAYRPDGKRLAVGYTDGSIRVWEPESGRLVQVLLGPHLIQALAWSPDGHVLAAGMFQEKQGVGLWDAENGRLLQTLEGSVEGGFPALAWSPDGRSIRARMGNSESSTWNADDGKLLGRFSTPLYPAVFSPDAKWLAGIQQEDGRTAIWDAVKGEKVRVLDTPRWNALWSVVWSPDGKRLAFGERNGLHVWDVESGKESFGYAGEISTGRLAWSPDGRTLAYGVPPFGLATIEVKDGSKPLPLEDQSANVAWSPDGRTLAGIPAHPTHGWVRLYDAATGKRRQSLSEAGVLYNPDWPLSLDGQTIAVSENGQTTLASVDTGQVRTVLEDTKPPLALSPDGRRVVTGGPNHTLILWESGGKVRIPLAGHEQDPTSVAWSPDGKQLASAAVGEKRLLLWDADKGERLREVGPFDVAADHQERWSPDGRLLAFYVYPQDPGWHFWDVEQNKLVNDPKQWTNDGLLAITPDGRSAWLNAEPLKDIASGKKYGEVPSLGLPTAWSPDGRLFAAQGDSGLALWQGDLRRRVRTLEGLHWPGYHSWQVAFSADGKLVLGKEDCRRLHVWETDTGRLHGTLLLGEPWNNLTITPEGHYAGNEQVDRAIVAVVQKEDGTQELLEPDDFEQKYGWKNEPDKVHLLQPLPTPAYPLPGEPLGPLALVREPAELPGVRSWTVETLSGRGEPRAVAYRPDGKLLATGGDDGTIRLWDPATGELVRMLVGPLVYSLSWSRDGTILAANCGDTTRLWDVATGRLLRRIAGLGGPMFWPPDGRTLAIADPGAVRFHDLDSGRLVRSFDLPGSVYQCAWSPDGKTLAFFVNGEKVVRLHDAATGKEVQKLEGHEGMLCGIAWSPDGKRLASVARGERALRVWDAATGKQQARLPVDAVWEMSPAIAWAPDGKAVALGFVQGPHGLFDAETGQLLRSFNAGNALASLAVSPDGKQVATTGNEGDRLHSTSTGRLLHTLTSSTHLLTGIDSLAWSPDGRSLAVCDHSQVEVLEAATGQRMPLLLPDAWLSAAWSPDGNTLAAFTRENSVRLWDVATSRPGQTLEGNLDQPAVLLAWSPDGKRVAGGGTGRLWLWSAETGKLLWQAQKGAATLSWSPDGRWLATTGEAVRLWEADTGKLLHESPLTWETQAAWSPDGKVLAAGPTEQGECLLIDAASGAVRVKARDEGRFHFHAVRWSADGKTIGIIDRGDFLRVFDAATGKLLRRTPLSWLNGRASWSPDGRVLAWNTGIEVHLYDSALWPLGVLLPGEPFAHLAVTVDGHYRGSARVEHTIRMVVRKRDGSSETLTPAEFEQKYGFHNDPAQVRLTPD
jgi:WD40 repeat protein/tRNA A-37 threonylcarbamoyl transferase component Bud32